MGDKMRWRSFMSSSLTGDVARGFASGTSAPDYRTVLYIRSKGGKKIKRFSVSENEDEDEVLFQPGLSQFEVVDAAFYGGGLEAVYLLREEGVSGDA